MSKRQRRSRKNKQNGDALATPENAMAKGRKSVAADGGTADKSVSAGKADSLGKTGNDVAPKNNGRVGQAGAPEHSDSAEKGNGAGTAEKAGIAEKPGKAGKAGKAEKVEKTEKSGKADKPGKDSKNGKPSAEVKATKSEAQAPAATAENVRRAAEETLKVGALSGSASGAGVASKNDDVPESGSKQGDTTASDGVGAGADASADNAQQKTSKPRKRLRRWLIGIAILVVLAVAAVALWAATGQGQASIDAMAAQLGVGGTAHEPHAPKTSGTTIAPDGGDKNEDGAAPDAAGAHGDKHAKSEEEKAADELRQREHITEYPALNEQERAAIVAKAQETAQASGKPVRTFSYCVSSKGDVGSVEQFENTAFRTLNDPRGWPRAGAVFTYSTDSGNCDMTLNLVQSDLVTTFSPNCSAEYSCRVGNNVIVNETRWMHGTKHWLEAGGTMDRYRTMVINHEVGHRLGHLDNEPSCPADGQPAPLMQEQSMSLRGCTPNEWPTDSELWIG